VVSAAEARWRGGVAAPAAPAEPAAGGGSDLRALAAAVDEAGASQAALLERQYHAALKRPSAAPPARAALRGLPAADAAAVQRVRLGLRAGGAPRGAEEGQLRAFAACSDACASFGRRDPDAFRPSVRSQGARSGARGARGLPDVAPAPALGAARGARADLLVLETRLGVLDHASSLVRL
jgi:hypothetical protein